MIAARISARIALLISLLMGSVTPAVVADPCAPPLSGMNQTGGVDQIKFNVGSGVNGGDVSAAMSSWNTQCQSGITLPKLSTASGDITMSINYVSGKCPVSGCGCGSFVPTYGSGGQLNGGTVRIYEKMNSGALCNTGGSNNYEDVIRHEFGHALGLDDASGSNCSNRIMANIGASVSTADCTAVNNQWFTPIEQAVVDAREGHPCNNPPR